MYPVNMPKTIYNFVSIISFYLFLASFYGLQAQEVLVYRENQGEYPLSPYLEILKDPGGKLSYNDVTNIENAERWIKNKQKVPNFAMSDATYWLRLKIKNGLNKPEKLLLELANPHHDYLEVYIQNGAGGLDITKTGDRRPFDTRQKNHRFFLFDVRLPSNDAISIYLRIQSYDGYHPPVPLTLWQNEKFVEKEIFLHYFLGACLGIVNVMAAFNLFIYLALRLKSYLNYVLLLLSFVIFLLIYYGFAFMLFWPDAPNFGNRSLPLADGLVLFQIIIFTRTYLQTSRTTPWLDLILKVVMGLALVIIICALNGMIAISIALFSPGMFIANITFMLAGIVGLKRGYRRARFFLPAFFLLFCGVLLITLRLGGLVPHNIITENGFLVGVIFNVVLLALGLADQINVLRAEKDAALEKSLQIQKEFAANLELNVRERTKELARANEKLQELDRAKSRFFTGISHEFRTPLTLILAPLESIRNGEYGEEINRANKIFKSILKNALRLHRLITNVLDFTRIEAGRMSVQKQKTSIGKFLEYYKTSVRDRAALKEINITYKNHAGELFAWIDRDLMGKAVMNLLSNAFKFTPAGGEICIELEKTAGERFDFLVKNNGQEIPEDKLEFIFERFTQADGSNSREYEGTGLGLSLTREIVELHGGRITAHNPSGKGVLFRVSLPRGQAEDQTEQIAEDKEVIQTHEYLMANLQTAKSEPEVTKGGGPPRERVPEKKHNILIVEDDEDMRPFLIKLLEADYNIHIAENGKVGLARAREILPDLILSDIMMPEMDGYEMTARIKDIPELQGIPIILLTAKSDALMKIEGLEHGADDYLSKPFNTRELHARIKAQLNMKILRDRLAEQRDSLQVLVQEQIQTLLKSEKMKRYLPPELVDALLQGDESAIPERKTERKKLTVFFSDIVDFTQAADQMRPEKLSYLLNDYISEMTVIVSRWGGIIDKFIGDAIMVHFGAFVSRGEAEDARACVSMALDMQNHMTSLQEKWKREGISHPFRIRCGINTGVCTVGNFGSDERMEYTIVGSDVNLASRLESAAAPGRIMVSEATKELVIDSFTFFSQGKIDVKGFSRPVKVFEVEAKSVGTPT